VFTILYSLVSMRRWKSAWFDASGVSAKDLINNYVAVVSPPVQHQFMNIIRMAAQCVSR